jgi:hypothetical protein
MLIALRATTWRGVNTSSSGDTIVYHLSAWWLAILAVPMVLVLLIGVAMLTTRHIVARLIGVVVVIAAAGSFVAIAPTVFQDTLVVTRSGFTHTAGFWWKPDTRVVEFDSLESMRVVEDERRGELPTFNLEFHHRDGHVTSIPKSTLLEVGLVTIFDRAQQRGVSVSVPEGPDAFDGEP